MFLSLHLMLLLMLLVVVTEFLLLLVRMGFLGFHVCISGQQAGAEGKRSLAQRRGRVAEHGRQRWGQEALQQVLVRRVLTEEGVVQDQTPGVWRAKWIGQTGALLMGGQLAGFSGSSRVDAQCLGQQLLVRGHQNLGHHQLLIAL